MTYEFKKQSLVNPHNETWLSSIEFAVVPLGLQQPAINFLINNIHNFQMEITHFITSENPLLVTDGIPIY